MPPDIAKSRWGDKITPDRDPLGSRVSPNTHTPAGSICSLSSVNGLDLDPQNYPGAERQWGPADPRCLGSADQQHLGPVGMQPLRSRGVRSHIPLLPSGRRCPASAPFASGLRFTNLSALGRARKAQPGWRTAVSGVLSCRPLSARAECSEVCFAGGETGQGNGTCTRLSESARLCPRPAHRPGS